MEEGVHTYLVLLDPRSLSVVWANDRVERIMAERGEGSAVGKSLGEVIPYADAVGIPRRLREVERTGDPEHLNSVGFSVEGRETKTVGSMYQLPSGELLLASEYYVDGMPA